MKVGDLVKRKFPTEASKWRQRAYGSESDIGIIIKIDKEVEMLVILFLDGKQAVLPLYGGFLEIL